MKQSEVISSSQYWPNSSIIRDTISLPLTLQLRPTALCTSEASFGDQANFYRCQSCRSFINLFCNIHNQHEYDCSICGCTNYIAQKINLQGQELHNFSYSCQASNLQKKTKNKLPVIIFIIDLTNYGELSRNYLLFCLSIVQNFVNEVFDNSNDCGFALVGFDEYLHVFNITSDKPPRRIITCFKAQIFNQGEYSICSIHQSYQHILKVLNSLKEEIMEDKLRKGSSQCLLSAVKHGLLVNKDNYGKMYVISGVRQQIQIFKKGINHYSDDSIFRYNYNVTKKQAILTDVYSLLNNTSISISFFIFNQAFINLMPFHYIAKNTNGQLRHYLPKQTMKFYYQFLELIMQHLAKQQTINTIGYESILKVRYTAGLKLSAKFGNQRICRTISDQMELLTCAPNRRYVFQFVIQGKINSSAVLIQFTLLFTDCTGKRRFKVITHKNKLSQNNENILKSINYSAVNFAYLQAVVQNMDTNAKPKQLQKMLKQKCKFHIKAVRDAILKKNEVDAIQDSDMSKVRMYTIMTFMITKHYVMNPPFSKKLIMDLCVQMRSKITTIQFSMGLVWPLIYAVNEDEFYLVQMQKLHLEEGILGNLVDRGDEYYIILKDKQMQNWANKQLNLMKSILNEPRLKGFHSLIEKIIHDKCISYLNINYTHSLKGMNLLDTQVSSDFDAFINQMTEQ